MEYKKTGNVRLKQGGGKKGPMAIKSNGTKIANGNEMGNDARKGLDVKTPRVR